MNLVYVVPRSQVGGFYRELVAPENLIDLIYKLTLEGIAGFGMSVDLGFRESTVDR